MGESTTNKAEFAETKQESKKQKTYHAPQLEKLGDLRSLTLGVTGGTGETGNAGTHYVLGMSPFGDSPFGG